MASMSSRADHSDTNSPFKVRTLAALVICAFFLQASGLCGQAPGSRTGAGAFNWVLGHQGEALSAIRQAQPMAFNNNPAPAVSGLTLAESVRVTGTITTYAGSAFT